MDWSLLCLSFLLQITLRMIMSVFLWPLKNYQKHGMSVSSAFGSKSIYSAKTSYLSLMSGFPGSQKRGKKNLMVQFLLCLSFLLQTPFENDYVCFFSGFSKDMNTINVCCLRSLRLKTYRSSRMAGLSAPNI